MKTYLLKFGNWLVRKYGPPPVPPEPPKELPRQYLPPLDPKIVAATKGLVSMAQAWDASGEYKRHFVYAKLIKEFPAVEKKILSLAIELVLLKLAD